MSAKKILASTKVCIPFGFEINYQLNVSNKLCPAELDEEAEGEEALGVDDMIIHADDEEVIDDSPSDCFPDKCYKRFPVLAGDDDSPFWQGWANLRLKTFQLIENKYFETAVITMILLSSLALVCFQILILK